MTDLGLLLFEEASKFRWVSDTTLVDRVKAALKAATPDGRCGFHITANGVDIDILCTKAKHTIDEYHAVTEEDGTEILAWPHPTTGGGIIRGCLL